MHEKAVWYKLFYFYSPCEYVISKLVQTFTFSKFTNNRFGSWHRGSNA
jgi:hypothetical protein